MACRERGMAMVSVVFLLTLLLALVHILSEKVWQSSRQAAAGTLREQLMWAAHGGIEWGRLQLAHNYRDSAGWQDLLSADQPGAYPEGPAWSTEINGIPVELFVRDNADGDDDPQHDNDLRLHLLARARAGSGAEAVVESLCGFTPAAGVEAYLQAGAGSTAGGAPDDAPLVNYRATP